MDTNQVGSINFDANALYLEEESEHELDDKQQDNEIKELISQGGLDGLLDDESLISSSGDSSYEEDDVNQKHHIRQHQFMHKNEIINENKPNSPLVGVDNEIKNDDQLFSPKHNMNPPSNIPPIATPLVSHPINNNYALNDYRNQFSTPSANQMPPLPSAQMLQATVIPNICEEKPFYQRQRQAVNNQAAQLIENNNSNPDMPKYQQTAQQPQYHPNDPNLLNYTNQYEVMNSANYMQIQQQHFVPHAKMHSLERFAINTVNTNGSSTASLMPNPAPQRLMTAELNHDPHEHLTNDHELSLNETDNEEDDQTFHTKLHLKETLDTVTPTTSNPKYMFGNGVQLEFSGNKIETNSNGDMTKQKKYEETSVIDLNELDEEQLKQLKVEEEKTEKEYFNIDKLNREYCQTMFLYKVRGKKLEEVQSQFATYQEDVSKEIRAMKHRLSMAEQENQSLQTSLDQAHDLCGQYKAETDLSKKTLLDFQEKFDKLKQTNRLLEQKLSENEEEIENLHLQINEQQKLDSLERVQEQHEHFIQQLRDQFEKDLFQMKEKLGETQADLNDKHNMIHMLRIQLDTSTKNAEMASVERADTINRLTKNLTDLQSKYDQDVLLASLSNGKKLNISPTKEDNSAKLNELKIEIQRLSNIADEMQREKNDLANDLVEKNTKLDQMMEQEEQFQKIKNSLELDIYSKQQHIMECEKLIDQLHHCSNQEMNNQQMVNEYEARLSELQVKITNQEHEIKKTREMYMEMYNDKINLQDTLKIQYDTEYESKLKQRVESAVNDKLEEQKNLLREKWQNERSTLQEELKRQIEIYLNDLKQCREQLNNAEKQYDQIRFDKANLEIKSNRVELELKDKCIILEKKISDFNLDEEKKQKIFQAEIDKLAIEINTLKNELSSCNETKMKADEKLNNLETLCRNLQNEKECLIEKIESFIPDNENLKSECNRLAEQLAQINQLKETDSIRVQDLEFKIKRSDVEINDLKSKLETSKQILIKTKQDFDEQHNREMRDSEQSLVTKYESVLDEAHRDFEIKLNEFNQIKLKLEKNLTDKINELDFLRQATEQAKQQWLQEKQELNAKKEEEFQKYMEQLEKRFEEDYSSFMQTHKEAIQRTLNEKTQEFMQEKEKLIDMYEKKLIDLESNEKGLLQKIREIKSVNNSPVVVNKPRQSDAKCQTENFQEDEINLLEKIRSLEELIAGTDNHFEQELGKLRQELEDEYQVKLKYELERSELNQRQLEHEIDLLRNRLHAKSSNNSGSSDNSSIITENNDTADFDLIYSSSKNNNMNKHKYTKLKQELNVKEKEMETVEQAYRIKIEKLQEKYEANIKQMQSKHDTDLNRCRIELNDNYKQALNKSKNEIEQMQIFVQKLKKTNVDSDRVIESLKQEMNKMKESHLDELTSMKLNAEREKEDLKEKCEQSQHRVYLIEQRLSESEEHLKKQCDLLRAELKHEYGSELSRMNTKMKDMMKSHATAVDLMKKQHHSSKSAAFTAYQNNKTCQTETSVKDIELLEQFRQRYLDTVTRMKADMMKHFDAQTQRTSERLQRQLSEERTLIQERLHQILLPKIIDLLREYRISETLIDLKMSELEKDLIQITKFSTSKRPENNGEKLKSRTNSPINSLANNYISSLSSPRPTNNDLYSKSATSIREIQQPSSVIISSKTDSVEVDLNKKNTLNSAIGGYKYTPLRQSWSNLSQMNQLSPSYSITSTSSNDNFKKETSRKEELFKSPRVEQSIRPSTTESIYKSREALDNNDKEDYVYFNDQNDSNNENVEVASNFYKKYRTHNIRQKKIKSTTSMQEDNLPRPQSASSLLMMNTKQSNSDFKSSNSNLYSSSSSNLNPIGTLYEMSKNYKTIRQLEEDDNNNKKSNLISRSSTQLSNCIDETPIKLDADKMTINKPTLRSATTVTNHLNLPRPVSNLSIKTAGKTSSSISSSSSTTSSRNRSRTPTSTCSSLLIDQPQSYRQPTVSSSQKVSTLSTENLSVPVSNNKTANLSTTSSTQYLPINTQSFQKKRTIF